jgi:hypothetical protein
MKKVVVRPCIATTSLLAAALLLSGPLVNAQTIERVKMTDNDLSCQQIYGEITQMDGVIARASQPAPVAPTAAVAGAVPDATTGMGAQVAGAVAQTAVANSVARGGFGGFGGFGGAAGGLGNLFGGLAQQAAQNSANQAATQQATTQQAAAQAAQQSAATTQQAQGRKEHLTGLFLGKGCKMSEIQR